MLAIGSATTSVPTAPACKPAVQVISQEPTKPTSVDLKALSARV
jgi:hypothetical protein